MCLASRWGRVNRSTPCPPYNQPDSCAASARSDRPLARGELSMAAPTPDSPIPPAARPIVEAVHRRYLAACERGERPAIHDPRVTVGLLTALECVKLAALGYYPIPPDVVQLGMAPAEHQRQLLLDAVAAQLPDAVAAMLETLEV